MKKLVAILLVAAFSCSAFAAVSYPKEVAIFIENRDACDHLRGEDPYDSERAKFLNAQMKELCTGTDRKLARLKSKYRANKEVSAKLSEYEPRIELNAK